MGYMTHSKVLTFLNYRYDMLDPNKHGVYNKVGWQGKTKQQVESSTILAVLSVIGFILLMVVGFFL